MKPEDLARIVKRCIDTGYLPDGSRACLLCSDNPNETMFVGLWLPSKKLQRRIGCSEERLSSGGSRLILYMVCQTCFESPNSDEEIETKLMKLGCVQ